MQTTFNWSQPQRQPLSGLVVALLKTFISVLKRVWPVILLALFREEEKEVDFFDGLLIFVGAAAFIGSIASFVFFRFYIEGDELIIKKGWLKKQVLTIPLQKIQAVHIEQGPLHQLLNIVKLSADTAGSNKTEVTIQALRKPMAEALRERLALRQQATEVTATPVITPLFVLGEKDLLKLAISANHLEAFFILLSAAFGIFENIKTVNRQLVDDAADQLPAGSVLVLVYLAISVLLITLFISTTRIFFKFYGFTAIETGLGLQLKSGLANTRERFVAFQKVQYVSWRANWLRQRLGLWLLRFHTAGGDEGLQKMKVEVPLTQKSFISLLARPYHPLPDTTNLVPVRIHKAHVHRHLLLAGILPAVVAVAATFYWWHTASLLFLLWVPFIGWQAWLFQQKFRLWLFDDVAFIERGVWGREAILLKWEAVQTVAISQSFYQRRNNLANLTFATAADNVDIPYIPLPVAQQLMNYCLYKVEREENAFL